MNVKFEGECDISGLFITDEDMRNYHDGPVPALLVRSNKSTRGAGRGMSKSKDIRVACVSDEPIFSATSEE